MKIINAVCLSLALASGLPTSSLALDLLERYPTALTAGDTDPTHARAWEFSEKDVFHISQFTLKVGDELKVETDAADLGIGHCADGAVWAVLIPRESAVLRSSAAKEEEKIAHIWLRFHPGQINQLFPADTVSAENDPSLTDKIRAIAQSKMKTSWHAGDKVMIPDPKDFTVFVDTQQGSRRFFVVDTLAQKAKYVDAFNPRSDSSPMTLMSAPPVVVKTIPEAGSKEIPAGVMEIKVTFSKEMKNNSWSWSTAWKDSSPENIEKPRYEADGKTCVIKVKLEAGQTYGYWLNSQKFVNFKDKEGHAAIPYLLAFQTKKD